MTQALQKLATDRTGERGPSLLQAGPSVRLSVLVVLTIAVVVMAAGDAWSRANLFDVRVGVNNGTTRVVLELDRPVEVSVFTLVDPYRVVIDLDQVRWHPETRTLDRGSGVVQRVRYGLFKPGTSRLVLDCTGPAVVGRTTQLKGSTPDRHRLVLDLEASTPKAALSVAKNKRRAKARGYGATPKPLGPQQGTTKRIDDEDEIARLAALQPATTSAQFRLAPRKPPPPFRPVIVIDPGHGGADPGAISVTGQKEKQVTLRAARALRKALERRGGYRVVLTRERDIFVRLRDRVAIARAENADLFLSLHADANPVSTVRGASVYTLSERASDSEAAALAERENKVDLIVGIDLSRESREVTNILIDLAQRETMNRSASLAGLVVRSLRHQTRLLKNTHRFAGFAVLKAPDVPSILVELGQLSNRKDDALLRRGDHLNALAGAMAEAVARYFASVEVAQRSD